MNIRLATIKDRDAVLSLLDELLCAVNTNKISNSKGTETQKKRNKIYESLLNRPDVKIFVAEENSHILGVADLFILPLIRRGYNQGHIEDLVVKANSRGKGIGTTLINTIINYSRQNGIKVIKLTSGLELTDAHRFYEKNGGKFTEKMYRFEIK